MESKLTKTVALTMAVLLAVAAVAATVAAAQLSLCNMSEEALKACKPYISKSKPEETPSDACCGPLKQANLTCLCSYKNSEVLPLLGIDPILAMQLPAKCHMTPPDQC